LLEGLGGAILETDQRARIVDAAEGNPFFVEQLLALALEGGLAERALPETVQALLAARLDRLGPGERAVLERGAVVGKGFTAEDVIALLEPEAAPTAGAHLRTLAGRGFVRPAEEGAFHFRHVLVQEAVYRAAPKRLRAELHERFADRLDGIAEEIAELDEFVGYHLERAYGLRTELGESDRRTARLAEDGGRRLGEAGVRALKRGDMHATTNLLGRATSLLPADEALRRELLCELGIALRTSGDSGGAERVLGEAIHDSLKTGDRRIELRARVEEAYVRLLREPQATADALLDTLAEAIPILETVGDYRALGRAWLFSGWVHGGIRCQNKPWQESAEHALGYYKRSGWPTSTCVDQIAAALYYGPTHVSEAISRCDRLLREEAADQAAKANVLLHLGGLEAQRGGFERARELIGSARATYEDLGQFTAALFCGSMLGDVELLAGDAVAAEHEFRRFCDQLEQAEDWSSLPTAAAHLAEALYEMGDVEESSAWGRVARAHAATDDVTARLVEQPISAKIAARHGAFDDAASLARDAVRLAERTDWLNQHAKVLSDLGEVLRLADHVDEAANAFDRATEIYERKGNVAALARTRALREELALV